jgi:hypothetical protein
MGAAACRRRAVPVVESPSAPTPAGESHSAPSIVLQPTSVAGTRRLPYLKFQRVVKRIRNILRLRRLWSQLGAWLNVQSFKAHPSRQKVSWTWSYLGGKVIRKQSALFTHLIRRRGHLQYRDLALERASRRWLPVIV